MQYCTKCKKFQQPNSVSCHYCAAININGLSTGLQNLLDPIKTNEGWLFKVKPSIPPFKVVSMKNHNPTRLSSCGDKKYDAIARVLQTCTNQDFISYVVLFAAPTDDLSRISIDAYREDWPFGSMGDPKGIKKAILTITPHKTIDIAVADGIPNLYCQKQGPVTLDKHSIDIYLAHWIKPASLSKFTDYRMERGYIAQYRNTYFHSTHSPQHAAIGVLRKLERRKEALQLEAVLKKKAKQLLSLIPPSTKVGFQDSRAAGNCSIGTTMFAKRHDLDTKKKYRLREIAALEPNNPHVRTLVVYMLRKSPSSLRELA